MGCKLEYLWGFRVIRIFFNDLDDFDPEHFSLAIVNMSGENKFVSEAPVTNVTLLSGVNSALEPLVPLQRGWGDVWFSAFSANIFPVVVSNFFRIINRSFVRDTEKILRVNFLVVWRGLRRRQISISICNKIFKSSVTIYSTH